MREVVSAVYVILFKRNFHLVSPYQFSTVRQTETVSLNLTVDLTQNVILIVVSKDEHFNK